MLGEGELLGLGLGWGEQQPMWGALRGSSGQSKPVAKQGKELGDLDLVPASA